jgi:hypothetical protein
MFTAHSKASIAFGASFEPLQHRQGVRHATQMTQADRGDQQQVAIFRQIGQPRLGDRQRFLMAAVLLQPPQADHLLLDGGDLRKISVDGRQIQNKAGQKRVGWPRATTPFSHSNRRLSAFRRLR